MASWPAFTLREQAERSDEDEHHLSTSAPIPPPPARRRQHDHCGCDDHGRGSKSSSRRRQGGGGKNNRRNSTATADADADDHDRPTTPTVETFSARRDERITVATPPDGFLFDLRLSARIPHPPDRVFEVLADEEAHKIFRGIRETVARDVLADDGRGKRSLLVAHRAGLRFLGLTAAFETRLRVDEDKRAGTIHFRGADSKDASGGGGDAFMKKFEGSWTVQPFNERALRSAYGGGGSGGGSGGLENALGSLWERLSLLGGGGGGAGAGQTLVTLEQALAPRLLPPRPLQPLVRALCGRTLQHMVEDLKIELERRERERRRGSRA